MIRGMPVYGKISTPVLSRWACRRPHHGQSVFNIFAYDGARPDDTVRPDLDFGQHRGADAYKRQLADRHVPSEGRSGSDVGEWPDLAMVLDDGAAVDDDSVTYVGLGVNDGIRANEDPTSHLSGRTD